MVVLFFTILNIWQTNILQQWDIKNNREDIRYLRHYNLTRRTTEKTADIYVVITLKSRAEVTDKRPRR